MTIQATIRLAKRRTLYLLALLLTVLPISMRSQQLPSESVSPLTAGANSNASTSASTEDLTSASTDSRSSDFSARSSLTATQINSILQQRPELIVELKSLLADQLQQQGIEIQADSITSEM